MANKEKPIDIEKVEQFAQVCSSEEEVARALGISYATLRRRKEKYEQFAQALKNGKAKANVFVGSKLMSAIREGNLTAIIFYLKCQCGWRETNRTEISGIDGQAIKTEQMGTLSNAELLAIAGMKTDEGDKGTSSSGKKGVKAKGG